MATVYAATDTGLDRPVAVKLADSGLARAIETGRASARSRRPD